MPATSAPRYFTVTTAGISFEAVEGCDPSFVHWAWMDAWAHRTHDGHLERPLPPELGRGDCVLKLYPKRSRHNTVRRLRKGRALHEGEGYRAFQAAGLPTPMLILYGEYRRLGLHQLGLIGTRKIEAPTVTEHWREHGDATVFDGAAAALARVHAAGLTHGDALARNFLATEDETTVFDLASWGRFDGPNQIEDLTRLLGSVVFLTGNTERLPGLLEIYADRGPELTANTTTLVGRAEVHSRGRRHD